MYLRLMWVKKIILSALETILQYKYKILPYTNRRRFENNRCSWNWSFKWRNILKFVILRIYTQRDKRLFLLIKL